MMKSILTFVLVCCFSSMFAQQLPYYTHNIINPFYNNAATAGDDGANLSFNYLNNWVGFSGSPKSYFVAFDTPIKDNMGIGAKFFSNVNNIRNHSGVELSYAYKVKLLDQHNLKFGISGLINQSAINFDKIIAQNSDETSLLQNSAINEVNYDANFAISYNFQKFNFGITANQLLGSKFTYEENLASKQLQYSNALHYFIYTNYTHSFSQGKYNVTPNLSYRTIAGSLGLFNAGVMFAYKDLIWANIGMNLNSSNVFSLGYNLNKDYSIAYTYSQSSNSLNNYSSGSHEIMFKIKFNKSKKESQANNANIDYELAEKVDFLKQDNEKLKDDLEEQKQLLMSYIDGLGNLKDQYKNSKESIDNLKDKNEIKKEKFEKEGSDKSRLFKSKKSKKSKNGKSSLTEIDKEKDEFKTGSTTITKDELTESIDDLVAEGEVEEKEEELGISANSDFGFKYIVVGGFVNLIDAKKYQGILMREYSLSTQIVENGEQSLFLVYTVKSKITLDFDKKMRKLEKDDTKKILVDKPWIYKREL
jgi:type IX secretion system PorP/SprF family membrane protein